MMSNLSTAIGRGSTNTSAAQSSYGLDRIPAEKLAEQSRKNVEHCETLLHGAPFAAYTGTVQRENGSNPYTEEVSVRIWKGGPTGYLKETTVRQEFADGMHGTSRHLDGYSPDGRFQYSWEHTAQQNHPQCGDLCTVRSNAVNSIDAKVKVESLLAAGGLKKVDVDASIPPPRPEPYVEYTGRREIAPSPFIDAVRENFGDILYLLKNDIRRITQEVLHNRYASREDLCADHGLVYLGTSGSLGLSPDSWLAAAFTIPVFNYARSHGNAKYLCLDSTGFAIIDAQEKDDSYGEVKSNVIGPCIFRTKRLESSSPYRPSDAEQIFKASSYGEMVADLATTLGRKMLAEKAITERECATLPAGDFVQRAVELSRKLQAAEAAEPGRGRSSTRVAA